LTSILDHQHCRERKWQKDAKQTYFATSVLPLFRVLLNNPSIHLPNNITLLYVDSAHKLGVIFDKNLSFAQHIAAVSKSCFHNVRHLRRIRITTKLLPALLLLLSFTLKLTILTLLLNLPAPQTKHLQLVLNSAARAAGKTP